MTREASDLPISGIFAPRTEIPSNMVCEAPSSVQNIPDAVLDEISGYAYDMVGILEKTDCLVEYKPYVENDDSQNDPHDSVVIRTFDPDYPVVDVVITRRYMNLRGNVSEVISISCQAKRNPYLEMDCSTIAGIFKLGSIPCIIGETTAVSIIEKIRKHREMIEDIFGAE